MTAETTSWPDAPEITAKHIIVVLSGKGGVGKSTVAVNIAAALAATGNRVGLLDVDIHGPSVPGMTGLDGRRVMVGEHGMEPVACSENLAVMSIGFLLQDRDDAVIWRGPMKYSVIKQFLTETDWGELDYLVIDAPPGTGDEPLGVVQLAGGKAAAVLVTTPQRVAVDDVRKSVQFCRTLNLPVLGIVENMRGFACPGCGEVTDIFPGGGGETLAAEAGVPYLGSLPLDPAMVQACDAGTPFIEALEDTPGRHAMRTIVDNLILELEKRDA